MLYQERGKQLQVYRKGNIVKYLPNVNHWHGTSHESSMTHISVNPNTKASDTYNKKQVLFLQESFGAKLR